MVCEDIITKFRSILKDTESFQIYKTTKLYEFKRETYRIILNSCRFDKIDITVINKFIAEHKLSKYNHGNFENDCYEFSANNETKTYVLTYFNREGRIFEQFVVLIRD